MVINLTFISSSQVYFISDKNHGTVPSVFGNHKNYFSHRCFDFDDIFDKITNIWGMWPFSHMCLNIDRHF